MPRAFGSDDRFNQQVIDVGLALDALRRPLDEHGASCTRGSLLSSRSFYRVAAKLTTIFIIMEIYIITIINLTDDGDET